MKRLAGLCLLALSLTACDAVFPLEPMTPPQPKPVAVAKPAPTIVEPPPPPADPATVTEGDVTVAYLNGMEILVKRIPGAEMSTAQLYIRGGVRNWTAEHAGVEELALATAAAGGTETLDKDAFAHRLAALGAELGAASGNDFASMHVKGPTQQWDAAFALLEGAFLHPALPATELELVRQRQLAGLRREQETPDGRLRLAVNEALFKGHPYARRARGTAETVAKLERGDVTAHLARLRETGRLVLVAVGDVDPAHVLAQAKEAFGGLPRGEYVEAKLPGLAFAKPTLDVEDKKLPTNYCESVFPAPGLGDADFARGLVAMSLLGERLFDEVRTKRNLSYAPGASLSTGLSIGLGILYVTAVDANTTRKVMLDEVRRLQTQPTSEKELAGTKSIFLTGYLMENEATDGQASMLARAQLLGGDWHLARTLPERIKAVTVADVQGFAQKYAQNLQTVVLGDPSKIDRALFGSM